MAVDTSQTLEIIEVMENFLTRKRPPENIRHQLDLSYRIERQSVVGFELRPRWDKPEETMQSNVAKATFIRNKNHWKVFWLRANLKWQSYEPKATVQTLRGFVKLIEEDKHGAFGVKMVM